jgi:hypothetical protein
MEVSLDLHLLQFAMEYMRRDGVGTERRDDDHLCGLHGAAAPFEAPIVLTPPAAGYSNAAGRIPF